ncbi:pleckstrin homology domain-containing family M member 2-like isoform X2 [Brienomyrus brachyistius]|uniref:pleckstrin homology domain-containing family M member 2-like isoform X2 n=1 Tax=Brienomyrus brachyistius TaxID=42636 RepID=UPI0020B3D64E|nr:pleckstrin homology domain-containing family M member 2-like isoform X2 [Brienomyrus brachyistius]
MDQPRVIDRILENISLSVKKLQSYFAACEDETPAIRNHDRVLQRLCEHLDHALLYGLQDISLGYWVLVVHFTRREAVHQIEELQHIATNLGRSRAWLYLALSESSLESYLRLFQENQALLQKYYFKHALVCSHDHLALFLTLVSGLEFIRFDLELDVPYLDVAPYMPEYYKPQNLLDFEERLPSSDSLSLHSFTSLTSTNLEWDDSAIAPSSEDYDFGDIFPVLQSVPNAEWEEGDLTDPASCPRSGASDPQTFITTPLCTGTGSGEVIPRSPTFRYNPFNEEASTKPSLVTVIPVQVSCPEDTTTKGDTEGVGTDLEVIRVGRRKKPGKKRRAKGASETVTTHNNIPSKNDINRGIQEGNEEMRPSRQGSEEEDDAESRLRLPEMSDTSMDSMGQPLEAVVDRLNGPLDGQAGGKGDKAGRVTNGQWLSQQQLCPGVSEVDTPDRSQVPNAGFLHVLPAPADFYRFAPHSPDPASPGGSLYDSAENGQQEAAHGDHEDEQEDEGAEPKANDVTSAALSKVDQEQTCPLAAEAGSAVCKEEEDEEVHRSSPLDCSHPAEFRVDNNHLLLLMIHVFRENEEQLFKMVKMSTGHMEGDLQPLYLLLTDCYIYLLRKGAAEKPYTVEEAVSYNELDYISVGLDQQTFTLVCTNRRRQFLLDTADASLTVWFLGVLRSAMIKGCREPPYPAVLTDATMEKLALTKFVSQESQCEVSAVSIQLYALVHWEDPMDMTVSSRADSCDHSDSKEGPLLYLAGTTYLGKEHWKSCYMVLSNGTLYQYAEKTDVTPLLSITMGGEHCGGCRRSHSTERPHAFQIILTEHPPLQLSAENEQDMAIWMQLLCQSVSKGVIPQGVAPSPCIPCCLVLTDRRLLTCHQDCQTNFFRLLGGAELHDITAICLEMDKEYCVIEFAVDRAQFLPPWVLYFSSCEERARLLEALENSWKNIFKVCLPRKAMLDPLMRARSREALGLIRSAWQRSDSLQRGRAQREPWC